MITYDSSSGSFRAAPHEINALHAALESADPSNLDAALSPLGVAVGSDSLVRAMAESLQSTIFEITLLNAGPGGLHEHHIAVGVNAVAVRTSPVNDETAELSGMGMQTVPGGLARLVRFRAGAVPPEGSAPVEVSPDNLIALAADSDASRQAAWTALAPTLDSLLETPEDPSWQLVSSACTWTYPDGTPGTDTGSYIRRGDQYFVIRENGPVPTLQAVRPAVAWEALIGVLPGQNEVAPPA